MSLRPTRPTSSLKPFLLAADGSAHAQIGIDNVDIRVMPAKFMGALL